MRRVLCALMIALSLPACTSVGTVPVSQALTPAEQAVQTTINETNILITAAANVLGQQVTDGITPKADAQSQLDQIRGLRNQNKTAQGLLDAGDLLGAKNQAELAKRLVTALQREIAERVRKPQ